MNLEERIELGIKNVVQMAVELHERKKKDKSHVPSSTLQGTSTIFVRVAGLIQKLNLPLDNSEVIAQLQAALAEVSSASYPMTVPVLALLVFRKAY